jgi:ribonucleoside-diphosphate reductase beta chain
MANKRFIIFPIVHKDIYELYKRSTRAVWFTEEIDFKQDRADFEKFHEKEQKMLLFVMAFFAASDSIVSENIISRFMLEVPFPESRMFYGVQTMMEQIHTETYALGILECVRDPLKQNELFHAIETMPAVQKKSQWAVDFMESPTKSLAERLVAYVIVEGVFFQGAFAVIFWFKQKHAGKLPGIIYSNELIAGDEALHTDHSVLVYRKLEEKQKLTQAAVHAIFQSAIEVERFFVGSFLEEDGVLGLNSKTMLAFIEYVCDYWITELGYEKLFGTPNPLRYMDMLSLRPRTNFFERRNREYSNASAIPSLVKSESFSNSASLYF